VKLIERDPEGGRKLRPHFNSFGLGQFALGGVESQKAFHSKMPGGGDMKDIETSVAPFVSQATTAGKPNEPAANAPRIVKATLWK
jgi:hypothetical protein